MAVDSWIAAYPAAIGRRVSGGEPPRARASIFRSPPASWRKWTVRRTARCPAAASGRTTRQPLLHPGHEVAEQERRHDVDRKRRPRPGGRGCGNASASAARSQRPERAAREDRRDLAAIRPGRAKRGRAAAGAASRRNRRGRSGRQLAQARGDSSGTGIGARSHQPQHRSGSEGVRPHARASSGSFRRFTSSPTGCPTRCPGAGLGSPGAELRTCSPDGAGYPAC